MLITRRSSVQSAPRNQFENHEAGIQDSGLFFCASYENWAVVFLASPAKSEGFLSPMVIEGSGLQILLIQKGLWAASPIPISHLGKKSDFLAVF